MALHRTVDLHPHRLRTSGNPIPEKNNPSDNSGRDSVTESQLSCLSKRQMENIRLCHFFWHCVAGKDKPVRRCVVTLSRWGSEKVSQSVSNNTFHAGLLIGGAGCFLKWKAKEKKQLQAYNSSSGTPKNNNVLHDQLWVEWKLHPFKWSVLILSKHTDAY